MIRPTFQAFETAKRALSASQHGLDVVGHNISNAKTPGYTRQRVDQVSISSGGYSAKYQIRGGSQFAGQGTLVTGISQVRDPYLDVRYRNEASVYGELAIKNNGLSDLENVMDEVSKDGVGVMFENFLNEITKFQDSPNSAELAVVVRNTAQQLTQVFNKNSSELKNVLAQQKYDLNVAVADDINNTLKQISFLNTKIREDNIYGNPSNELNDERNMLIDKLSENLNIKVVRTPEKISDDLTIERFSIVMVDNSTAPSSEFSLVDGGAYNGLAVNEKADGSVSVALIEGNTGFPLKDDITGNITKGAIRGYLDIINGKGDYAGMGENGFRGVPYYINKLDSLANVFADKMNELNSISQEEADQTTGVKPYPDKNLFKSVDGKPINASNLSISDMWLSEPTYLTVTKLDPPVKEPLLDNNGLPVYDENGNQVFKPNSKGDNLLKFKELLTTGVSFNVKNGDGDPVPLFKGSFAEFVVSMQSDVGLDQKLTTSLLKGSDLIISGFADQRDAISAVSVDEEAINMMTYQNYYNAAARYMTTIDEALGKIIEGMGVVGR